MKTNCLLFIFCLINGLFAQINYNLQYNYIPKKSFTQLKSPNAPDYSKKKYWAALPTEKDGADKAPKGYKNNQKTAKADVFYIHPNTYRGKYNDTLGWNTGFDKDYDGHRVVDDLYLALEASVFNGPCKVYAPKYRQTIDYAWERKDSLADAKLAIELTYSDIKTAFIYYLKNHQKDRPFFIASDGEGTFLAIRLIKDLIENKPLQKKLVAAYLIGYPVNRDSFTFLKPCNSETDIHCVLSWGAYNIKDTNFAKKIICQNPLNWSSVNNKWVLGNEHLGLITFKFKVFKGVYATYLKNNQLFLEETRRPVSIGAMRAGVGPNWEYQCFYMDMRKNIEDRLNTYFISK